MNKNYFKKTLSSLLILIFVFSPVLKVSEVFGQQSNPVMPVDPKFLAPTTQPTQVTPAQPTYTPVNVNPAQPTTVPSGSFNTTNSQNSLNISSGLNTPSFNSGNVFNYNPGAGSTFNTSGSTGVVSDDPSKGGVIPVTSGSPKTSSAANGASEAVTCSVGAILAGGITNLVSVGTSQLTGTILRVNVPVQDVDLGAKEVGLTVGGVPIFPGWDAVAYCLGNAAIIVLADSTIAWIQSGFEGKPVFVDDPTKLFQDIADYELETFLGTLGGGFLCEPFEPYVKLGLVNSYTEGYSTQARCTLDQVQGNIDSFLSGDSFDYDTWFSVTQNPANNPYGSYLMAKQEAQNRIDAGVGPLKLELDWGNGFLPWKGAKGTVNEGKTITTGQMIEAQLQETLGLAPERLVLAEKFDQVTNVLIDQLLKTALNETFEAIGGGN